jgi:hypothetical protein
MDILDSPEPEFWWDIARNCPYATFYHTPLWHRLAVETDSSRQDRSVGAVFDNGTRAVLPLLEQRKVLKKYVSTFAGCYGGLIADGSIPNADAQALYEYVFTLGGKKFKFISNPLADAPPTPNVSDADVEDDFTHILELDRDLDAIVSEYSRGHRSSLNKGRRKGVTVRRGETLEDYQQYYEAYEASLERWGKDPSDGYPWDLFEHAHALSQDYPDAITLWLTCVGDAVASGALTFQWNRHVSYWHGAAHEEYFDYRPNNVLHTDIIGAALLEGYRYYDFNPSGGYDGVAQFKSRFGAKKRPVRRRTYTRSLLEAVLGGC